jgi:hypothetical protein
MTDTLRLLAIMRQLEMALETGKPIAAGRAYQTLEREKHDHPWLKGYLDEVQTQLDRLREESARWTDWPDVETEDGDIEPLDVEDDTHHGGAFLYTRVQSWSATPPRIARQSRN